jgi:FMN phosphatase YigB (HAD superfamily)
MNKIDVNKIKLVAFDCFGTIFDMSTLNKEDIKDYVAQTRDKQGEEAKPVVFPPKWYHLQARPYAMQTIYDLREHYWVVTLSNGSIDLLAQLSYRNEINWDLITPLEIAKVYKTCPESYQLPLKIFQLQPEEMLMVTANPTFGDVEACQKLGIQTFVINHEEGPKLLDLHALLMSPHY